MAIFDTNTLWTYRTTFAQDFELVREPLCFRWRGEEDRYFAPSEQTLRPAGNDIGAWLDRSGRRSLLYKVDRLLLIACLLGILAAAGHTPVFVVPLLGFITGTTLPATFGGLTSVTAGTPRYVHNPQNTGLPVVP